MRATTFRTKIIVLVISIVFLVAGFQQLVNVSASERYITLVKSAKMQELFDALSSDNLEESLAIRDLVEPYEFSENLHIEVFNENHQLLYTSGRRLNEGFEPIGPDSDQFIDRYDFSLYPPNPGDPEHQLNNDGSGRLILRGRIDAPEGARFVIIEGHLRSVEANVSLLNRMTLIVSLFMLLIGIFAAYLVAQLFSTPLKEIAGVAGRVAKLDFSKRANEEDHTTEIASLAMSINTMADRLEQYVSELEVKNEMLREDNLRLQQMEEMRRQLIANVSHELKSPLALMGGYAEILRDDVPGMDKKECCDVIIRETDKMNQMIRSLLQISSLENGSELMRPEAIDISDFIEEAYAVRLPVAERKGLRFTKEIEGGMQVIADAHYLGWAVNNYLENAMAHSVEKGRIHITLKGDQNIVRFAVYNEGPPIAEKDKAHIWDSFYRSDAARTRDSQNNIGLGLYIVRTVITSLGGDYGVENVEGGVVFHFTLPREKAGI